MRTALTWGSRNFEALAAVLCTLLIFLAGGCTVDVQDGLGPRVPEPDVEGLVWRGSSPAVRVDVELHNVATETKVFDSETNSYGFFMFHDVPGGLWELRAESELPGDFASVSRQFYRADGDGKFRAPDLDISAHGAGLVSPASDAGVTAPTPFEPLDFHWMPPANTEAIAQVQLYDSAGQSVWRSSQALADSARWYGFGSEGTYQGVAVGPGQYEWRVKFEFPDTMEARTERRILLLE